MDSSTLPIIFTVLALVLISIVVLVLRLDAGRIQRERERHAASREQHQLEQAGNQRALATQRESIVIGSGREQLHVPTQPQPVPLRDDRIKFREVQQGQSSQPPPQRGIVIGQTFPVQENRKCPLCRGQIEHNTQVMECQGCHTQFHQACWEGHLQERRTTCPGCGHATVSAVGK